MKDLAGTVTTWLIYHVVDTDQKLVSGEKITGAGHDSDRYTDLFSHSTLDVLEAMAGLDRAQVRLHTTDLYQPQGDIFVKIQRWWAIGRARRSLPFPSSWPFTCWRP
ncbi:hypothetical protein [Flavonifractor sp. An306]|uniref:hypothetical protein n=1 Tax=Flavonifractor sp. An306 TaxID=1965629 RepID=UPI000B37A170|nr:hypothetical protein [Flavonifractor sp. An306]OUO39297.1 hypothetical protein B5F88_09800 [Flavonifractor sp. An306]